MPARSDEGVLQSLHADGTGHVLGGEGDTHPQSSSGQFKYLDQRQAYNAAELSLLGSYPCLQLQLPVLLFLAWNCNESLPQQKVPWQVHSTLASSDYLVGLTWVDTRYTGAATSSESVVTQGTSQVRSLDGPCTCQIGARGT